MRQEQLEKEGKNLDHCGMKSHMHEECFQINGYPK